MPIPGVIQVTARPAFGIGVACTLSAMTPAEDVAARRRSDGSPKESEIRILAVDDDPAYQRHLRLVLARAGFTVEMVRDGEEALRRFGEPPPIDILLIDLAMPGIDGIETLSRLRGQHHPFTAYTILLTASDGTDVKLRALDSGFDDFVTKTATDQELVAKLRSAARRVELERRLHLANQQLQALALTDELTGTANRRALFHSGQDILRAGRGLSMVLFDLDRFKEINDTHGHLAGDRILEGVAGTMKAFTRYGDILGRYGGDEFFLLLPDTSPEEALQIAERLLSALRQLRWTFSGSVVSVSAQYGVAASLPNSTITDLLARCDKMLYRRKSRTVPREDDRAEVL